MPGLTALAFVGLAILLIWIDRWTDLSASEWNFSGDASAARSVLSTIAGSLITIAGLTFSITIVALQLASAQFSPRVLRTFMGDKVTQVTAGTFIGIFIYCLLVLRSVRSGEEQGDAPFVPSLSITIGIGLAVFALALLLVFIHHMAQLIQVSHVAAVIARQTIDRLDVLYPEPFGSEVEASLDDVVSGWSEKADRVAVLPPRLGFVQRVAADGLVRQLGAYSDRVLIDVTPGEFVSLDRPIGFVWGADGNIGECEEAIRSSVILAEERNLTQDLAFGLRQLTDIALRAISPSVNDPTTAVTCIGYLRSILAELASRGFPSEVREFTDPKVTVAARQRSFPQFLESLAEIGGHANGDRRVVTAILEALEAAVEAAVDARAADRAEAVTDVARAVVNLYTAEATSERDIADAQSWIAAIETRAAAARSPRHAKLPVS